MQDWCSVTPDGVRLAVQITPGAKKNEVLGVHDGALKLKLQAQPIEGQANEALVRYLAKALAVPRSAIRITHGLTSRKKLLEVAAPLLPEDAARRLLPAGSGGT